METASFMELINFASVAIFTPQIAAISVLAIERIWRPRRDLNPCYRRERPVSWARLDDGDAVVSRAGFEPATLCLKGRCSTA
jgi:hypothetical protein